MAGRVSRDRICCASGGVCWVHARPTIESDPTGLDGSRARSSVVQSGGLIICCVPHEPPCPAHARTSDHSGPDDPVSHVESAGPYATLRRALDRYLAGLRS